MRRRRFRHLPLLWLGMCAEGVGLLTVAVLAKRRQRRALTRGIDGIYVDGRQVVRRA